MMILGEAQWRELMAVLTEIRDLLAEPPMPPEDDEPECPHAVESRTDFSSMGRDEWICHDCGHHYIEGLQS